MGEAHGVVGENLGTGRMPSATALLQAELAGQSFAPLSVLLVENFDLPHCRAPGFPDESFIRSEVPMTKQEVRAAALAKLAVNAHRHSVGRGRRHRQCERGACAGGTQRPRVTPWSVNRMPVN